MPKMAYLTITFPSQVTKDQVRGLKDLFQEHTPYQVEDDEDNQSFQILYPLDEGGIYNDTTDVKIQRLMDQLQAIFGHQIQMVVED